MDISLRGIEALCAQHHSSTSQQNREVAPCGAELTLLLTSGMLLPLAIYTWEMPVQLHHIKSNQFKLVNRNRQAKRENVPNPIVTGLKGSQLWFILKATWIYKIPWPVSFTKKFQRAGDAKWKIQGLPKLLRFMLLGPWLSWQPKWWTDQQTCHQNNHHCNPGVMLVRAWVVKLQRVYLICVVFAFTKRLSWLVEEKGTFW